MNRAASIGVALPCVVPKEWIAPPDFDTAEGELLDEDDLHDMHESSRMLRDEDSRERRLLIEPRASPSVDGRLDDDDGEVQYEGKGKGKAPMKDTAGRVMPPSERAPIQN